TAQYLVAAPGGIWNSADNGIYTLTLEPGQVGDVNSDFASQSVIGTFQVNVGAVNGGSYNDIAYDGSGRLYAVYYDSASKDLRFMYRSPKGTWSVPSVIDNS